VADTTNLLKKGATSKSTFWLRRSKSVSIWLMLVRYRLKSSRMRWQK